MTEEADRSFRDALANARPRFDAVRDAAANLLAAIVDAYNDAGAPFGPALDIDNVTRWLTEQVEAARIVDELEIDLLVSDLARRLRDAQD